MRISAFFATLVAIVLTGNVALAVCVKDATVEELTQAGAQGEKAFADGDLKQLRHWAGLAREEILPCLKAPITPKHVAIFHRLMAIEALTRYNFNRVKSEFQAARRLDPGYAIPPEVAEGDHPLIAHYNEAATLPDGEPEAVYPPDGGYVIVGGVRNAHRLSLIPVVVQVYAKGEVWMETRYFLPGEKLPKWGENPFGFTAKDFGYDATPWWKKPTPWYISAGVSAVIAGVFYGLAMNEKVQFQDRSTPDADLSGLRDRANAFGWTAVSTGGLAVLLAGAGVGISISFGGDEKPTVAPAAVWSPTGHSTGQGLSQPFAMGELLR